MFGLVPRRKGEERLMPYVPPTEFFRREFAPIFERMFGRWPIFTEEVLPPYGAAVEETAEAVIVREAVPGFEVKEIEVKISGNLLTVHAEKKEKKGEKGELWGKLDRTICLPEGVDTEHVEAVYRNGVLEVRLPKLPTAKDRLIEVKTL